MAKPIVLYHYPESAFDKDGVKKTDAGEVMKMFNDKFPNYYWLCFPAMGIRFPKIQVYYEKDMDEVEYDELVKIVTKKAAKIESPHV